MEKLLLFLVHRSSLLRSWKDKAIVIDDKKCRARAQGGVSVLVPGSMIVGKGFVWSCMVTVFGKYGGMVSGDDVAGTSPAVEDTSYILP